MRERKTSRILNDESFFLGLSYTDISGLGIILLGLILFFKSIGFENMLGALFISLVILCFLIPIRMNFRRKIIRDSLFYFFRHGVVYVSKNSRNK